MLRQTYNCQLNIKIAPVELPYLIQSETKKIGNILKNFATL